MNFRTFNRALAGSLGLLAASSALGDDFPVSFSGFFSNGYIETSRYNHLVDSENGSTDFVEIGLNASWSPFERTVVNGQLFAFELGQYGNYEPTIDYLFVDYNVNQMLGLRAGRVKRPHGVYNEIQDIDIARTSILLPIGIYDPRYRDFSASVDGLSAYGNLPIGKNQSLEYNAYHGRIHLSPDGGVGAYAQSVINRQIPGAKVTELTSNTNTGIQVWWNTPVMGLRTGGAYTTYPGLIVVTKASLPAIFPPNPALAGAPILSHVYAEVNHTRFSLEYYLNQWTFVSEYEFTKTPTVEMRTTAGFPSSPEIDVMEGHVFYVSASRRFHEKLQGGITYTDYLGDVEERGNPGLMNRDLQFSLRYDATSFWSLKAEIHSIEGTNRVFNQSNQNPVIDEKNWTLFALKSTFTF